MPRVTNEQVMGALNAQLALLEIIAKRLSSEPVVSAPVTHAAAAGTVVDKPRTFATKAERLAGKGFACTCGRRDLRVAPKSGSFHKAPDGTTHTIK